MTINPALINIQNPKLDNIRAEDVAGYRIIRSFSNKTLFNVHAVTAKGDLLVCVSADIDFDTASALVETLNAPHELEVLHELQETELVEVKVKTEDRIFTAKKGRCMTFKYLFNNMENIFLEIALLIILFAVSTGVGYAVTVVVVSSLIGVCVGIVTFLFLFIFFIN